MLLDQKKNKNEISHNAEVFENNKTEYDVKVVNTKQLRVRKFPMIDASVLTTVPEGAILHISKNRSTKDWLYAISVLNKDFDGYVMKEYTEVV